MACEAMRDRPDSTDLLLEYSQPVLVIAGADDQLMTAADADNMKQAARNSLHCHHSRCGSPYADGTARSIQPRLYKNSYVSVRGRRFKITKKSRCVRLRTQRLSSHPYWGITWGAQLFGVSHVGAASDLRHRNFWGTCDGRRRRGQRSNSSYICLCCRFVLAFQRFFRRINLVRFQKRLQIILVDAKTAQQFYRAEFT